MVRLHEIENEKFSFSSLHRLHKITFKIRCISLSRSFPLNFTILRDATFSCETHAPGVKLKLFCAQKNDCKVLSFAILPFFGQQLHCDLLADISTQDFL